MDFEKSPHFERIVESIIQGNCVAFVGAGLSLDTVGSWKGLLATTARQMGDSASAVLSLINNPDARNDDLETAAQIMASAGRQSFLAALSAVVPMKPKESTARRIKLLRAIPFAALVTTNFDGYLSDVRPADGADPWHETLRGTGRWYERYGGFDEEGEEETPTVPVIELHGNIRRDPASVVFAEDDYRTKLYHDPHYLPMLRALLATKTPLFLGFSFSDAYIRLLLAETFALFERTKQQGAPLAYAVMSDVSSEMAGYFLKHKGIGILSYAAPNRDHRGFDEILELLGRRTSPEAALRRAAEGKRILWCDKNVEWNRFGARVLKKSGVEVVQVCTPQEAIDALMTPGVEFHLVLTRFGYTDGTARQLLRQMHERDLQVPVIVFASDAAATANKRTVQGWGALDYVHSWEALFERIEMTFTPGALSAACPFRALARGSLRTE